MNQAKIIFSILFLLTSTLFWADNIKKGDVICISDFNNKNKRNEWSTNPTALWVQQGVDNTTCLFVNSVGMVHSTIHLSPFRGMKLQFRCKAKAENVTKPTQTYLGVKYMLHYKSASGETWRNEDNVYGTFDWKELSFIINIPYDATDGDLNLGLQGSTGKVWFDSLSVKVINLPNEIPILKKGPFKAITKYRGVMSPLVFKPKDFQELGKRWGANLIRWQLTMNSSESKAVGTNLTKYDSWLSGKLKQLDSVLIACHQNGIRVVIDLHSLPGGRNQDGTSLFYDSQLNNRFISIWQAISLRYRGNPTVWGYDLMNEPVQNKLPSEGMDYIQTQVKAAKAIRQIDKKTAIIFEVEYWDSPAEFSFLSPIPVSNVIYEVHMYQPGIFTHQGVHDNGSGITYPGSINGTYYDKNKLTQILQPVRDFQLRYHVPVYVGEFSAIRWAPGAAQYLDDCIDIFEKYGWNWTYHAYREWNGWDIEYENGTSKNDSPHKALKDTDRKKVLLKWFGKNRKIMERK